MNFNISPDVMRVVIVCMCLVEAAQPGDMGFRCTKDQSTNSYRWTESNRQQCLDGKVISVTKVFAFNLPCGPDGTDLTENDEFYLNIISACNGKKDCSTSDLDPQACIKHNCITVVHTCNTSTTRDKNRNDATTGPDEDNSNNNVNNKDNGDNSDNNIKDKINQDSSNKNRSDKDNDDQDNDDKMKPIVIAVVSSVAIVATSVSVTLCLLFFCCSKSPLFRGSNVARPTLDQPQQQQYEGEYDYVDESKIEAMNSLPTDDILRQGMIPVYVPDSATHLTPESKYTSDNDDNSEISSNESPAPVKKTLPTRRYTPVVILPVACGQFSPSTSAANPFQLIDRHTTLPNSTCTNYKNQQIIFEKPEAYLNTIPCSTKHTLVSSSTEELRPIDFDPIISKQIQAQTICTQPDGIYSVTRSPSNAEVASSHSMTSLTGDYAHLTRPGNEPVVHDAIYDS